MLQRTWTLIALDFAVRRHLDFILEPFFSQLLQDVNFLRDWCVRKPIIIYMHRELQLCMQAIWT